MWQSSYQVSSCLVCSSRSAGRLCHICQSGNCPSVNRPNGNCPTLYCPNGNCPADNCPDGDCPDQRLSPEYCRHPMCMHLCMCVHIRVHALCACKGAFTCACMHACMYIYAYVYNVFVTACVCVGACMNSMCVLCTGVSVCMCVRTYTLRACVHVHKSLFIIYNFFIFHICRGYNVNYTIVRFTLFVGVLIPVLA